MFFYLFDNNRTVEKRSVPIEIISFLIENNAQIDLHPHSNTILHSSKLKTSHFKLFLEKFPPELLKQLCMKQNNFGYTPLNFYMKNCFQTKQSCDYEIVKYLHLCGSDINSICHFHDSKVRPLYFAACLRHLTIVNYLLEKNAFIHSDIEFFISQIFPQLDSKSNLEKKFVQAFGSTRSTRKKNSLQNMEIVKKYLIDELIVNHISKLVSTEQIEEALNLLVMWSLLFKKDLSFMLQIFTIFNGFTNTNILDLDLLHNRFLEICRLNKENCSSFIFKNN